MWDTVQTYSVHLSHDLPCPRCGHALHSYLPCSDTCDCARTFMPGTDRPADAVRRSAVVVPVWATR